MNRLNRVVISPAARVMGIVGVWSVVILFVLGVMLAAPAWAENEGLEDLDQATQIKVTAKSMQDLETVVKLCESAIQKGLDEGNRGFAIQLLTATLYERAQRWTKSLTQGNPNENWPQLRTMACRDLRRAIRRDDDHGESHLLLARLQLLPGGDRSEGHASAIRAVELLQESPKRHSAALVVRAGYRSDPEERLRDLDQAIELDATNLDAWRQRGAIKLALGKTEAAIEDFTHLLDKNPDDVAAMEAVAQAFASQKKFDEALEYLDTAIEKDANTSSAYTIRAKIYLLQGKSKEALKDLGVAIDKRPRDVSALLTRAQVRHISGDTSGALNDIERALRIRPGLVQAVLLRSVVYASTKRYREAAMDLSQLLQLDKENVPLRLQLAAIYVLDSNPRKAIRVYDDVLGIDDRNFEAMRGRADALLSIGKHAEAITSYEQALEIKPGDDGVLNNLAWVLATSPIDKVRSADRAIALATKACEATDYKTPHVLSTLAAAYAEKGDFENAIKWSTKAVELCDDDMRKPLTKELENYKQSKPWREMQEVTKDDEARDDDLDVGSADSSNVENGEGESVSGTGDLEEDVESEPSGKPEEPKSDTPESDEDANPDATSSKSEDPVK